MLMNGFIKAAFILFGTRIVFGNTNCSRFVQKLMRHLMRQLMGINGEKFLFFEHELFTICSELMRQLMGINGETFLAGSAPKKN